MQVSETRLAVLLQDNASAGLQSLTNTYNRFSNTIQNSGSKLAYFNRQVGNMNGLAQNVEKATNSLSRMSNTMERLVYSASRYLVIYKALGAVGNVWDVMVGGSYEYAKSLETNQIGIAGILKSMITLNGETVQWNDAMKISGEAMKSLQSEALRTAATSKELIETFRALLGPGLSSGMSIDQIVKLSTIGTNAVRSLGLPTNQYVQELRSIITEGIRPASSTLATSLGITNKDIKAAKQSAEGLYEFLMKRMQGFSDAVKYTSGTVEGRIARIQEGLQVAGAKGAQALYNSFSEVLEKIANYLIPIPETLGEKWQINPDVISGIEKISETIGKLAKSSGEIGEFLAPFVGGGLGTALTVLDQLADKLKLIFQFMLAKKAFPFVADIANLVTHSREAYEAQTIFGKALQGVNDRLKGRNAEIQKSIELQKLYNKEIETTRVVFAQQRQADKPLQLGWKYNQATDAWKSGYFNALATELQWLGTENERIYDLSKRYFQYLKTGTKEGAENIKRLILEKEREYQATLKQVEANYNWKESLDAATAKASVMLTTLGGLGMSIGVVCDLLGQANEENKEFYESAGSAAMQAGMFATAIGSIIGAINNMIPALANGIEWLGRFAKAKSLAGLGLAGGVAVGVAAIIKNAYNNFERTGIASQLDEYGDEVSHDFGNSFNNYLGNIPEVGNIDKNGNRKRGADFKPGQFATNKIAVQDFGGGGKGGGEAKANKAEEYAARIAKHVQDLNKEITNLNGQATAYEKTMASAKDKIASYEKDIVKAEQLGVDVGEVRAKQLEYQLAMEKKATEAQQDEYLKYMKLDEDAANRIYTMGGTMDNQRQVLAERLEAHKAYLEELLAADIDNVERRRNLEAELANVVKQINDNAVYDFKQGWTQALQEIANQQINFKDVTTSLFSSLESGLVTLVSSTGTAKDKFKQFCQDITNTILKSMTQIIIKGLITKAVMAAIGLGGGGSALQHTSSGATYQMIGNTYVGNVPRSLTGLAGGGTAQAGGTYIVGENGPELLQMGTQSGRIYNNRQTNAMTNNRNIKVELINKSDTELKATKATATIDDFGDMVISAWIEGVTTDKMGSRSLLKGMASAT